MWAHANTVARVGTQHSGIVPAAVQEEYRLFTPGDDSDGEIYVPSARRSADPASPRPRAGSPAKRRAGTAATARRSGGKANKGQPARATQAPTRRRPATTLPAGRGEHPGRAGKAAMGDGSSAGEPVFAGAAPKGTGGGQAAAPKVVVAHGALDTASPAPGAVNPSLLSSVVAPDATAPLAPASVMVRRASMSGGFLGV